MKTIEEITRQEFEAMAKHHKKMDYSTADVAELVNLVRLYVDRRQASCTTCSDTLRAAKTKLNSFYMANKEKIEAMLIEKETPKAEEPAAEVVEKKKQANKKK